MFAALRNLSLVGVIVGALGLTGQMSAQALAAPPGPVTLPGSVMSAIVGDSNLPGAAASRTAGYALANGAGAAVNTSRLLAGAGALAAIVPAFKLGYSIGTWIDEATGITNNEPAPPAPTFVPYAGETLNSVDPGFDGGRNSVMVSLSYGGGLAGPYVCSAAAGLTAGQVVQTLAPAIECVGPTYPATNFANYSFASYDATGQLIGQGTTSAGQSDNYGNGNDGHLVDIYPQHPISGGSGFVVPGWFVVCTYDAGPTCAISSPPAQIQMVYRFPGSVGRPPPVAATPLRENRTTARCLQADGTTTTSYAYSLSFTETAGVFPAAPPATCSAGRLIGSDLDLVDALDLGKVVNHLSTYDVPQAMKDWLAANPNCLDAATCPPVVLSKKNPDGINPSSCFNDTTRSACADWFADPAKDTTYQCSQGTVVLSLADCNMYSPSFQPPAPNLPHYGDPKTGVITPVDPAAKPAPMDDPLNQPLTPQPDPSTNPDPSVNPTVTPAPFPLGGGNGVPLGTPTDATAGGTSCMGAAWSWNPLNWVYVPVKCAVIWAFVPTPGALESAFAPAIASWNASPPGLFASGITDRVSALLPVFPHGADGCRGPSFTVGPAAFLHNPVTMYPFSACDEPVKTLALIARVAQTAFLAWIAFVWCSNQWLLALGFSASWLSAKETGFNIHGKFSDKAGGWGG